LKQESLGPYVAEVWLDWEICRGSTLYRQSFHSKRMALLFAKVYAVMLDASLPKLYRVDDSEEGCPCFEHYNFEIKFGVRSMLESEASRFTPFFTSTMPGFAGFAGEHREAHPLLAKRDELADFQF